MFTILIENIRLDIAVSKGMNHLLKAPFVIHPKTGRVCVPFRVAKVDSFDPDKVSFFSLRVLWNFIKLTSPKVPTVLQLVEEIDSFSKAEEESEVKQNHSFVAEITPIIVDAGEKECESVQDDLDARASVYL